MKFTAKKSVSIILLYLGLLGSGVYAQEKDYSVVTYNVENLFDADGIAVFDDYKPTDRNGNPQYEPEDVYTKIRNIARVLKQINSGNGPDIIAFAELESDYTPFPNRDSLDYQSILKRYSEMTLKEMLVSEASDSILTLPSELLLLKGMEDQGLSGYQIEIGFSKISKKGRPINVQKNAVFSRLPIQRELTRRHELERARPILETWIDVDGHDLVLFANHWKSGAGSPEMEDIRIQNATVLRKRLDSLRLTHPNADIILAGDFNSEYNQYQTMPQVQNNGINHVLMTTGDELKVSNDSGDKWFYNLWYDLPVEKRGSEVYRGEWSTVMSAMVNGNMYDNVGLQYVDNSFEVMAYEGLNAYALNGGPIEWTPNGPGAGFSDHFPLLFRFQVAEDSLNPDNPGQPNSMGWEPPVPSLNKELAGNLPTLDDMAGVDLSTDTTYYNNFVVVNKPIDQRGYIPFGDYKFKVFTFDYDVKEVVGDYAGTGRPLKFIGKVILYRTTWELVIESEEYLLQDS